MGGSGTDKVLDAIMNVESVCLCCWNSAKNTDSYPQNTFPLPNTNILAVADSRTRQIGIILKLWSKER